MRLVRVNSAVAWAAEADPALAGWQIDAHITARTDSAGKRRSLTSGVSVPSRH
jgi:hypothetical protein